MGKILHIGEHRNRVATEWLPSEHINLIKLEGPTVRHTFSLSGKSHNIPDQHRGARRVSLAATVHTCKRDARPRLVDSFNILFGIDRPLWALSDSFHV